MSLLTRSALLCAKIETTTGVDAGPTASADAVLVENPEFSADFTKLMRDFATPDLSPKAFIIGRKLAGIKFSTELRGNGKQSSGLVNDLPMVARLLRGCGFGATALSGTGRVGKLASDDANSPTAPVVTWTAGGTPSTGQVRPILFTIEVTTGGASATAAVRITNNNASEAGATQSNVVLTSGSTVNLGTSGATLSPAWTGNLVLGDKWRVVVWPVGVALDPVSNNQESLTLHLYLDGIRHTMPSSFGTFSLKAEAGAYPKLDFTFTGLYVRPTDVAIPANPNYESTLPSQIELSNLTFDGNNSLIVGDWSVEMANTVSPRPDVNSPNGFHSLRVTDRKPVGGFTPETTLESDYAFWAAADSARRCTFISNAGTVKGNIVSMYAPQTQVAEIPYSDRDGTRTYNASLGFARYQGNDELRFVFC